MRAPTPSQTVGPFFAYALPDPRWEDLVPAGTPDSIELTGGVYDADGQPVIDALVEIWQPDPSGRFAPDSDPAAPGFHGFGRCATDAEGRYRFRTLLPGSAAPATAGAQAPHIAATIFARGLLNKLLTRIYFPADAAAHRQDVALAALSDTARATLLARPITGGFRQDFHLGGERETAFLAF